MYFTLKIRIAKDLTVWDSAYLKNKLMGVITYFLPAEKINKSVMRLVHGTNSTYSIIQSYKQLLVLVIYTITYLSS
jgi:hypothetical protein